MRFLNKSNRLAEESLQYFQPLFEVDVSYQYIKRLYGDPEVKLALHNLFVLLLKEEGASGDLAGDGTGYSVNVENHYRSDPKKYCRVNYNLDIRECISDHGSQFYGERRDKNGLSDHRLRTFKFEGIKQILCGVRTLRRMGRWRNGLISMSIIEEGMVLWLSCLIGTIIGCIEALTCVMQKLLIKRLLEGCRRNVGCVWQINC